MSSLLKVMQALATLKLELNKALCDSNSTPVDIASGGAPCENAMADEAEMSTTITMAEIEAKLENALTDFVGVAQRLISAHNDLKKKLASVTEEKKNLELRVSELEAARAPPSTHTLSSSTLLSRLFSSKPTTASSRSSAAKSSKLTFSMHIGGSLLGVEKDFADFLVKTSDKSHSMKMVHVPTGRADVTFILERAGSRIQRTMEEVAEKHRDAIWASTSGNRCCGFFCAVANNSI